MGSSQWDREATRARLELASPSPQLKLCVFKWFEDFVLLRDSLKKQLHILMIQNAFLIKLMNICTPQYCSV